MKRMSCFILILTFLLTSCGPGGGGETTATPTATSTFPQTPTETDTPIATVTFTVTFTPTFTLTKTPIPYVPPTATAEIVNPPFTCPDGQYHPDNAPANICCGIGEVWDPDLLACTMDVDP